MRLLLLRVVAVARVLVVMLVQVAVRVPPVVDLQAVGMLEPVRVVLGLERVTAGLARQAVLPVAQVL